MRISDMYISDVKLTTSCSGNPIILKETAGTALVDGANVLGNHWLYPEHHYVMYLCASSQIAFSPHVTPCVAWLFCLFARLQIF